MNPYRDLKYSFLIISALTFGLGSSADEGVAGQSDASPIPELPPEEIRSEITSPEQRDPEESLVINLDPAKKNSGFLSDDSFNQGISRYLNAIELDGYFRMRFNYFRNGHLKTYIPELGLGTSKFPPNLGMLDRPSEGGDDDEEQSSKLNPNQSNFSGNMRLRVNPTINVSEVVRVRATLDVFDNLVLGSTSSYLHHGMPSPWNHSSLMAISQNPPMAGISVKRVWGEVSSPIGELRFGSMPMHWGLGILHNSGDAITSDLGDQIHGIEFSTRIFDHFVTPGYSISYTGPAARGVGNFLNAQDFRTIDLTATAGQRYPLESSSTTHVLSLSILKRHSEFIESRRKEEGRAIFNYGLFSSYRRQYLDSQAYGADSIGVQDAVDRTVLRDAHVGMFSLWSELSFGSLHLAIEAAGVVGHYRIGEKNTDLMAKDTSAGKRNIWLLQGGIALESKIGFMSDRLQLGLDGGWASHDEGPGFGLQEGGRTQPTSGDPDGRKLPSPGHFKTNFRFNPAYTVDLLMYREVLGGISGTMYLKPHLAYFFSRNFGLRTDVITAIALDRSNTTGDSNWLGVELDASAFLRSESGFYFQLAYGILFPFAGLGHRKTDKISSQQLKIFGDAHIAQTLQAFIGVVF